jgi:hypothetical protein
VPNEAAEQVVFGFCGDAKNVSVEVPNASIDLLNL